MTTRRAVLAAWLVAGLAMVGVDAGEVFEWHTLVAMPGMTDELHARLRDRVLPAIGDRGRRTVAVFIPAGGSPDGVLHLVVEGSDAGGGSGSTGPLTSDADWLTWLADGDGPPIATHRSTQRLRTTAWSPQPAPSPATAGRVFELRTYTCPDTARREALLRRFEQHTMALFERHGMTNVIYWMPLDGADADTKLVYLLAHESVDAAKASFDAFRKDPEWIAAKTASEAAAGGSLTVKEKGVVSEFLMPASDSPLR